MGGPIGAGGEIGAISSFYIPATAAAAARGRRVLKNGDIFAVLDEFGHIQASGPAAEGLFFEDTRYLSRLALSINGMQPLLLSSTPTESNTVLSVDLANPELVETELGIMAAATVHVLNSIALGVDALFVTVTVHNYGIVPAALQLAIDVDADFVDMFEVRGTVRARRGLLSPVQQRAEGPVFAYRGLDGVNRRSISVVEPKPETIEGGRMAWNLRLVPGADWSAQLELHCERDGRTMKPSSRAQGRAALRSWQAERQARVAGISTSNAIFDDWLRCSRGDLDMLITETAGGLYPYAGVPWFSTAFGRDGLITAFECLWLDPDLAAGTLRFLAANQATVMDPKVDAEPGKILHETRQGEMAALGEVPFGRYYGSIDATPLFVMLAAAYYDRTGNLDLIGTLWSHIEAALAWMSTYGDLDGDGFIEYRRKSEHGLDNQGWKDSADAIFHRDGSLAEAPIALAEVQAYAYAAYLGAATLAQAIGRTGRARELEAAAEQLKERFEAAFWLDELATYALALDGTKRPCQVIASNAGHALFAGIAQADRAAQVCQTLMAPNSYSGWGIRTIAEGQPRYNPMSYHNGSVWPHDNALIALGFARYGLKTPALRALAGMFGAAQGFELQRLPELFCGFGRRADIGPTAYPLACAPQAWSAAAVFALLAAVLGISFTPERQQIRFFEPVLPAGIDEMHLTNLRIGAALVDLDLWRDHDEVAIDVVRRDGPVEIVMAH